MKKLASLNLTQGQVNRLAPVKKELERIAEETGMDGMIIGQIWLHGDTPGLMDITCIDPSRIPKLFVVLGFPDNVKQQEILDIINMYYGEEGLEIYKDYLACGCTPQECFNQVVKML